MSYELAVEYLYSLQKYGIKFGLSKTSSLLKAFGNPHRGQRYVHIAGTNGKGSVAAMVESILRTSGLKVGLYSSPICPIHGTLSNQRKGDSLRNRGLPGWRTEAVINPAHPPPFSKSQRLWVDLLCERGSGSRRDRGR